MLIEFGVKNWRSIKETQTLSLVMDKGGELVESNSFESAAKATARLLRSSAIYGPNAAGKSNFIHAMQTMRKIVVESASKGQRGDPVPVVPFLLDSETEKAPTEFEVLIVAEGVRYQYGFSATTERIIEEWLLAYPVGRPQRWFDRAWNSETQSYDWEMGSALSGQKQIWQDATRENALFLSTAVQLNSKQLQPVYDWFKKTLHTDGISYPLETLLLCKSSDEQKEKVLDFLRAADFDILDVMVKSEKMSLKHFPEDMPDDLKKSVFGKLESAEIFNVKTVHKSSQGHLITFDFEDESDGTQKLFAFAGPWLDALNNGYVLFIDELHDNLHPKLVQFLVKLFHGSETNPNNAQLIFTTHETSILDQNIFRRDQIWFCEKDNGKATLLFPLTKFSPRKGRENLEANYLAGRYGALPYPRSLKGAMGAAKGRINGNG